MEPTYRTLRQYFGSREMEEYFPNGAAALCRRYRDHGGVEQEGIFAAPLAAPAKPTYRIKERTPTPLQFWPFELVPVTAGMSIWDEKKRKYIPIKS